MPEFPPQTIRSITYAVAVDRLADSAYLACAGENLQYLKDLLQQQGFRLRTLRLNATRLRTTQRISPFRYTHHLRRLSEFCRELGVRWFNICFDLTEQTPKDCRNLANIGFEAVRQYPNAFVNFIVATRERTNPGAAAAAADMIMRTSRLSNNGFDNFRTGVSLNPSCGTPFFPFSFADAGHTFSIAFETTQQAAAALRMNPGGSLEDAGRKIRAAITEPIRRIDRLCRRAEADRQLRYAGVDASFAPFPDEKISVVDLLRLLGLDAAGSHGTMFLTAFLTDTLKAALAQGGVRTVGFNGVMYSLLEDHLLCEANNHKLLSIDALKAYATLCGCGLDMVPLPGALLEEELASIILDTAAIAVRLDKPLGVRVLPIPNGEPNEFTRFDSDFLTNTRILPLKNHYCDNRLLHLDSFTYATEGKRQWTLTPSRTSGIAAPKNTAATIPSR